MSEKNIYKDLNNIIIDENEFDNINMTDMQKFKLKRSLIKKIRTKKVSIRINSFYCSRICKSSLCSSNTYIKLYS